MDWAPLAPIGLLILIIVAALVLVHTGSPRSRVLDMKKHFEEGGLSALSSSPYFMGTLIVEGVVDWAVHSHQEQQVNMGVKALKSGVVYATTNYLDIPFTDEVMFLIGRERALKVQGKFVLAQIRQSHRFPSLQPYVIVGFQQ